MTGTKLNRIALFFILCGVCLQGCTSRWQSQEISVKATWTPMSLPTDQPYQVEPEKLSYFGELPALVIFGSQAQGDGTPLKILNLSTEDEYDVSSIPPSSADIWSRPIVGENKDVYFQMGDMLYILSPGGQVRSIELPYDEENPAYCNWSWKGQLVCLNNAMTTGFLVDQDLEVVEMNLPADGRFDAEGYYQPYRIGENGMRTIYATPEISSVRATAFYKDLDLETLTVESKQVRIEADLYNTFHNSLTTNELDLMDINRLEGEIDVIGISESGEKVYLASHVTYTMPYRGGSAKTRWWTDVYDGANLDTLNIDFEIVHDVGKSFKDHYLITGWLFDPGNGITEQPTVYDLENGEAVFSVAGSVLNEEIINFILPYAEGWVAGDTIGVYYYRGGGGLMGTYFFPENIVAAMDHESVYTITQPMEP
jgi:hypothetical protein